LEVADKGTRLRESEFNHLEKCSECLTVYAKAEKLYQAFINAGLAVMYSEAQHGPALVVHIRCRPM